MNAREAGESSAACSGSASRALVKMAAFMNVAEDGAKECAVTTRKGRRKAGEAGEMKECVSCVDSIKGSQ